MRQSSSSIERTGRRLASNGSLRTEFKKRKIVQDSQYSNLFYLGDKFGRNVIYKYLNLESVLSCLSSNNIRFVQPSEWADKSERRFYNASYAKLGVTKMVHPSLYACCFTTKKMSEAAWKVYSYDKKGLAHRCVKLGINIDNLRQSLNKFAVEKNFNVYESVMTYSLNDDEIEKLHKKTSPYYSELFSQFDLDSYLNLLSIKRNAFSHEEELRYFLIPKDDVEEKQLFVNLSYKELIVDIKIAEDSSDMEQEILKTYCLKEGVDTKLVEPEKLYNSTSNSITIEGEKTDFVHDVIELIKKKQGIQVNEISKELGLPSHIVRNLLDQYKKEGRIMSKGFDSNGKKWYTADFNKIEDKSE